MADHYDSPWKKVLKHNLVAHLLARQSRVCTPHEVLSSDDYAMAGTDGIIERSEIPCIQCCVAADCKNVVM